jgi:plastocyanin
MKNFALASIAVVLLAACEGEPPKVPQGTMAGPAAETVSSAPSDEPEAPAAPEKAASAALPPCACNCQCTGGPAKGPGAVAEPSAPVADSTAAPVAAAPVAAAPAGPVHAVISGAVETVPKFSAGHAVVYLEDAPIAPGAKMTATVANKLMNYTPYVSVVPAGGKVLFRNDDPFPHNVFSADGERFDIGTLAQGETKARVFKTAGSYSLLCNLHPGMLGYVVVTPSSYYAKADSHGHFAIKDVPAGTYKVTAWAPRLPPATQSVTVKDGDVTINFDLHR